MYHNDSMNNELSLTRFSLQSLPLKMEQSSTSTRWKRYIRDVSANLCLIYISHLPLSYSVTINRTRNSFDPTYVEDQYVRPKGRFMDFKTISNNFWFSIEKWIARKYHTLLLYPFATYQAVNTSLYWFSFNIVPSTGIHSSLLQH